MSCGGDKDPTEADILRYKIAFRLFDKGNEGTVSIKDLSTILRSLGQNVTESVVQYVIDKMDAGVSGTIDFPELCLLMTCRLGHVVSKKNTIAVLRALGGSLAAVRYVMTSLLSEPLTDDEFDAVLTDDFVSMVERVRSDVAAKAAAVEGEESGEESDEEAGEDADEEADEESGEEAGEDADEESDEKSDEEADEESDEKSDEESGEEAAPVKGKMCWYMNSGEQIEVEVVKVSRDDGVPYYSICMPDGSVRETEGDRLVEVEEAGEETVAGELARLKQHKASLKQHNASLKQHYAALATENASLKLGGFVALLPVKGILQTIALDVKYAPKRAAMAKHLASFENAVATPLRGNGPLDRANANYLLAESDVAAVRASSVYHMARLLQPILHLS